MDFYRLFSGHETTTALMTQQQQHHHSGSGRGGNYLNKSRLGLSTLSWGMQWLTKFSGPEDL